MFNPKINYNWVRGRHSTKAGYEFQHIQTQVQDVNPLYGRDQYASQFSRPAGAASSNIYNLADFMFGLRGTFAISNILVADLRQNMHFTYLQDDIRLNDRLTLNLGLRYEFATPHWEKNNLLSNFDPTTRTMVAATNGSLQSRTTIAPDRNNLGPRLGLAYSHCAPDRCSGVDTGSATFTSIGPAAPTSCRSTVRKSSTRLSCRAIRWTPRFAPRNRDTLKVSRTRRSSTR